MTSIARVLLQAISFGKLNLRLRRFERMFAIQNPISFYQACSLDALPIDRSEIIKEIILLVLSDGQTRCNRSTQPAESDRKDPVHRASTERPPALAIM